MHVNTCWLISEFLFVICVLVGLQWFVNHEPNIKNWTGFIELLDVRWFVTFSFQIRILLWESCAESCSATNTHFWNFSISQCHQNCKLIQLNKTHQDGCMFLLLWQEKRAVTEQIQHQTNTMEWAVTLHLYQLPWTALQQCQTWSGVTAAGQVPDIGRIHSVEGWCQPTSRIKALP